jgi:DNA-directed RNA polymerase specialized sigma24 family protein
VVLCYLEGFTRIEAAAELDVSPETVKTHLDRARISLANRLEGHP